MKNFDLTPTWEATVRFYIYCLEDAGIPEDGKATARAELMRLATAMDAMRSITAVKEAI